MHDDYEFNGFSAMSYLIVVNLTIIGLESSKDLIEIPYLSSATNL
jgi:hypothetical protein